MTKSFILTAEPCKNYTLKSWPSCPRKFEQKIGHDLTWNPARILTSTFSCQICSHMRSNKKTSKPQFLQCFLRNRGLVSEEALVRQTRQTRKTSRTASILKDPRFRTNKKKTPSANLKNGQKHRNNEKPKERKEERKNHKNEEHDSNNKKNK